MSKSTEKHYCIRTSPLIKSTVTVALNTLVSRVLGLVRDIIIARIFGASDGVDAFLVAFRVPNFLRRLFAEGAFSQAFVPVLTQYQERRNFEDVRELTANVFGILGGALLLVSLVGVLAAPVIVAIFAPGFLDEGDKFELTVSMVRITFPYILFISLTAFAGAILNTYDRFGVPAFTPVLLNISLIACAVFLAPYFSQPIVALSIGVLIAGIVQLGFQLPFLAKLHLLVWPRIKRSHEGVRKILRLMLPALVGVSVAQINLLVDTLIASFLVTGSVTWLYYSDRMVEFPLGVFGIALGTVILPNLSQQHAQEATETFSRTLDWALRLVVVIGTPAALGLAALSGPILTTLFHYGAFSDHDVAMASLSLMAYSLGLVGFIGVKVLVPGFTARQDMRTPVRIAVAAMLTNIVLNLAFVVPLAHAGLALATSLSAFLNAGLLLWCLQRDNVFRAQPGWPALITKIVIANVLMVACIWWARGEITIWLQADLPERVFRLGATIAVGISVYFVSLAMLGLRPRMFMRAGRSR